MQDEIDKKVNHKIKYKKIKNKLHNETGRKVTINSKII